MSGPVVYSTNPYLKYLIYREYRGDVHYVWCSENFDSRKLGSYTRDVLVPPSSNPADIYRQLLSEVERTDGHSPKIEEQKASLSKLAIEWTIRGEINETESAEIIYMVNEAPFGHWRPLIYVISRELVGDRMKTVPIADRAGFGNEYVVEDLTSDEFDLIEL